MGVFWKPLIIMPKNATYQKARIKLEEARQDNTMQQPDKKVSPSIARTVI